MRNFCYFFGPFVRTGSPTKGLHSQVPSGVQILTLITIQSSYISPLAGTCEGARRGRMFMCCTRLNYLLHNYTSPETEEKSQSRKA
jgi:hypothetical protein